MDFIVGAGGWGARASYNQLVMDATYLGLSVLGWLVLSVVLAVIVGSLIILANRRTFHIFKEPFIFDKALNPFARAGKFLSIIHATDPEELATQDVVEAHDFAKNENQSLLIVQAKKNTHQTKEANLLHFQMHLDGKRFGIGKVDDDNVEELLRFEDELHRIGVDHPQAVGAQAALVELHQLGTFQCQIGDHLVDVDQDNTLH